MKKRHNKTSQNKTPVLLRLFLFLIGIGFLYLGIMPIVVGIIGDV
jgi:hypothetical protein